MEGKNWSTKLLAKTSMDYVGGGRVPSLTGRIIVWLFLTIVTLTVWSGKVYSSRKVERSSMLVILVAIYVALIAIMMSPPIVSHTLLQLTLVASHRTDQLWQLDH